MQALQHKIAESVFDPQARIRETAWEDAQEWCNFSLLRPDETIAGARIATGSLRPEAPPGRHSDPNGRFEHGISNRASYRCEVIGKQARGYLKQFFYDLGPPAWDHPCFWLSGSVEPVRVGESIAWTGHGGTGAQLASMAVDHTLLEFEAVEGRFDRSEIEALFASLRPVSSAADELLRKAPYAYLCYQRRHPDLLITVPMGYWEHRRRPPALLTTPLTSGEFSAASTRPPPVIAGYALDSALLFGDLANPQEIELIYRRGSTPEHWVRLLIWPAGGPGTPGFPPKIDRQPCRHDLLKLKGAMVWHAWLTPEYGQHEAVWSDAERVYMLLCKPAAWTGPDFFFELIEKLL
jgi:hypothetical protein